MIEFEEQSFISTLDETEQRAAAIKSGLAQDKEAVADLHSLINAPHSATSGKGHYKDQVIIALKHFARKGCTLQYCTKPFVLDRSLATLKAYCRKANISFPDYTPRHMLKKGAENV